MTKAKTSTHKGWADETFSPSHVTVFANELSDIVEGDIMEKVSLVFFFKRAESYNKDITLTELFKLCGLPN